VTLGYRRGGVGAALTVVESGRQYLDNTEDNRKDPALRDTPGYASLFVEEHAVLNGALTFDLVRLAGFRPFEANGLALEVRGLNLTGLKYETAGYVFAGIPYFYPAADRNVFVSLRADF
jgi:hypothetical protein